MKKNKFTFLFSVCVSLTLTLASCASSDSNTGSDVAVNAETQAGVNDESGQQASMDTDTNMDQEDTTNTQISANNPIGRGMNIVALVQQNPDLSTFLELLKAADMVVTLESPAPYTVFAPTNQAFNALPAGTVQALKQPGNKLELTRLLQAHMLPSIVRSAEMQHNMRLKSAQGEEIPVSKSGQKISVGDASIIIADVSASNGVVHVIDRVLVPPRE